jgi:hypothetical protein
LFKPHKTGVAPNNNLHLLHMPNLNTFSTLHERVKKCCVDYGLEDNSTAFMWLALEAILQLNPDDIEDAITDGGQDGGLDAIHI